MGRGSPESLLQQLRLLCEKSNFPEPVSESMFYAGTSRNDLVDWIMQRLLRGHSVQAFSPLIGASTSSAPTDVEEQRANGIQTALLALGVRTNPDIIRGCVDLERSASFLLHLLSLLLECERPTPGDAALLALAVDSSAEMFVDTLQLFPSDIEAAAAACSGQELPSIAALDLSISELSAKLAELRRQVTPIPEDEWERYQAGRMRLLSMFVEVSRRMGALSAEAQWRSGRDAEPAAPLCGIGPTCSELLPAHRRLQQLLSSCADLQRAHAALTQSVAPLQGLQADWLKQLVDEAGEEGIARDAVFQQLLRERSAEVLAELAGGGVEFI